MPMTLDGSAGMTAPVGAVYNGLQRMTSQATLGASFDFIGIPLWVERITVMFNAVSLSGSSSILVQVGSGSVTTSGYVSTSITLNDANSSAGATSTSGFIFKNSAATDVISGHMTITNITGNTWVASHVGKLSGIRSSFGGGDVTLAGSLDRLRVTTSGSDTYDAGSVNVIYE